jgi:predicted GIY-YIG superfamily endonuclease
MGYSSSRLKISEICLAHSDGLTENIVLHEFIRHDSVIRNMSRDEQGIYFYQVAKSIVELTKGKILVAEDAYQEFTLLKREFVNLGYNFNVKSLSIASFLPQMQSSLGLTCVEKISLTSSRLSKVLVEFDEKEITKNIHRKIPSPAQFDDSLLQELPPSPGVYFYKDKLDNIIYIGKAKNLSKRVPNHLGFSPERKKHLEFKNAITKVDCIPCSSEIEAILLEIYQIKKWSPPFNRKLKTTVFRYGIFYDDLDKGYHCRRYTDGEHPLRTVRSKKSGIRLIEFYQRESIQPNDLDFDQPNFVLMLGADMYVEIKDRRWLNWRHSDPLDLYLYPEIKGELLKWIKSEVN